MERENLPSPFVGSKIKLRAVEKDDVEAILKHWNTYQTRRFLVNVMPMSRRMEEEWIEQVTANQKMGKEYVFVIERLSDGELLGTCGLHSISWIHRNAVLGIAIYNPANWNKGYGTETMQMLLNIGFNFLNLHRIELEVLENNPRAISVYKKVGFKEVGRRREAVYLEGTYIDSITMDILRNEYRNIKNE